MAVRPTQGGSIDTWGTELNAWLDEVVILKTLIDAKGDLLVGSAADAVVRLAAGVNGNILIADNTQAGGMRWGSPGSATDGVAVYNVKRDYGAVGDGVADDTAAIQNAVTAGAANGRPVYIPEGTYKITSNILIPHAGDVRIFGAGRSARLLPTTGDDLPVFYHKSNSGVDQQTGSVTITDLAIIGAGQGIAAGGQNLRGGIWLEYCNHVFLERLLITDHRDFGINIYGCSDVHVNWNECRRIGQGGGWQIININTVTYYNQAAYGDHWCIGNTVSDTPNGGIALSTSNLGTVDPTAPPNRETRLFCMWNKVENCDWVGIAIEQRYSQYGLISQNQVYNCWVGIQIGTGGGTEYNWLDKPRSYHITHNIVDHRGRLSGSVGTGYCIGTTGGKCTISDNFCRPGACSAIVADAGGGGQAEDVVIENNEVEYAAHSSTGNSSASIYLNQCRHPQVRGNDIHRHNTRVVGAQTVGAGGLLNVETVEGFASSGTILVGGTGYAYTAITQATTTVTAKITLTAGGTFADGDYVFQGSGGAGVYCQFTQDPIIQNNTIRFAPASAIQVGSTCPRPKIKGNQIQTPDTQNNAGSARAAIYVNATCTDPRIESNDIYGGGLATIGVQFEAGVARGQIINNQFDGYSTPVAAGGVGQVVIDRGNRSSFTAVPNGGIFTSTPGAVTTLNIAHGLNAVPTLLSVQAGNANARGAPAYYVTADSANITLTFASALTAATSYSWNWRAEV